MDKLESKKPLYILSTLIVIITALHYSTHGQLDSLHEVYKLLYYIPIILAAFYFGVKGGLITSLTICSFYLPHVVFQWHGTREEFIHRALEVVIFITVGYIVGKLAESEQKQRKRYKKVAIDLDASYAKLKHQSAALSEIEEQLRHSERLSVMGELAASLAHEVGNPLGSIKGAAEILQDDYDKENQNYRFLQILIKEVDRVNFVIENFLNLARQSPPDLKEINLQDDVNSVVQIVSAKARKEKVEINCRLNPEPIMVKTDDGKFRQVLLNLLINAIAATNAGGQVVISTKINIHKNGGRCCELKISDNGCGIPKADLENVFKPFYTTKKRGTGLGLPITKRIADEYNWSLQIESEEKKGTTVMLCIPLSGKNHAKKQNSTD